MLPRDDAQADLIALPVQNFSAFWSALKQSEVVKSQEETDLVKWTFNDGTELEVKQEEHSVSNRLPTITMCTC